MTATYLPHNDKRLPIGKRKVEYVKYQMRMGVPALRARSEANRIYGTMNTPKPKQHTHTNKESNHHG